MACAMLLATCRRAIMIAATARLVATILMGTISCARGLARGSGVGTAIAIVNATPRPAATMAVTALSPVATRHAT